MSHFRHRSFILTSDLDVDCQKMICYVNVKLSKCLELKFEQLVFENWTDCNFWQTDFISFDRWNLEHSKIQSNQLNRFLIGPFIPDHAPNLGLVWAWTKPRIYVPKWKDHTYGVMIICRKYLFSHFLWFSSFSRFEILKTTFWYFKILPLFEIFASVSKYENWPSEKIFPFVGKNSVKLNGPKT